MKNQGKKITVALFWGSLWGLAEATFGYLAHLLTVLPGISGFIMFPIGFYFMSRAYREYGKSCIIIGTALVAMSIKLVDLLMPGVNPLRTINPAVFIILEALAVVVVLGLTKTDIMRFRFTGTILASVLWRAVFVGYAFLLESFSLTTGFTRLGFFNIGIRFLVIEALVNALIIYAYVRRTSKVEEGQTALRKVELQAGMAAGFALLIIAVAVRIGSGML